MTNIFLEYNEWTIEIKNNYELCKVKIKINKNYIYVRDSSLKNHEILFLIIFLI